MGRLPDQNSNPVEEQAYPPPPPVNEQPYTPHAPPAPDNEQAYQTHAPPPPSPSNQQPPYQQTQAAPTPNNYYPQHPSYPPPPVQFPPTPTKGDFQANQSQPVQYPPPADNVNSQQQYQYYQQQQQQQQQPNMNNYYQQGEIGMQQSPYNKPPGPVVASGIPVVGTTALTGEWTTQLFDCMDDPMNALITLCFPCITFGQIADIIDRGQTSCATSGLLYALIGAFIGVPCIMSCSYRTKLRNTYGLMETPAPDWVTHFLCEPCALCQAYRELNNRGLDPSIGWIGNLARQQQQQQAAMMPPTYQNMTG